MLPGQGFGKNARMAWRSWTVFFSLGPHLNMGPCSGAFRSGSGKVGQFAVLKSVCRQCVGDARWRRIAMFCEVARSWTTSGEAPMVNVESEFRGSYRGDGMVRKEHE